MAEKKRIIRVVCANVKEAMFKLSEEERKEFIRKDRGKLEELGYKLHFITDCSWSNEEWQAIGVEEWPSLEAIEKYEKFCEEELEASKYAEVKAYLGTPISSEYNQPGITNK
jgi:hypothetical protein